jgi:hypothetical protein
MATSNLKRRDGAAVDKALIDASPHHRTASFGGPS